MLDFLFWLFLFGIIVAVFQDIKRREVDDWLNLFLIISGFSFIIFKAIFTKNYGLIIHSGFILFFFFILMNLFYYGRVFAGGDAKLLFSISLFFLGVTFFETLSNIGVFIFLLMALGSIYGLIYYFILYLKDFKDINKEIRRNFWRLETKISLFLGWILVFISFVYSVFLIFGLLFIMFPLLYAFSRGIDKFSMVKIVNGRGLREGDWLYEDISIGKKVVKPSWDGLSKKEINLLKDLKKIKIKEGIPFTPAFLIAFIAYFLFNNGIKLFFIKGF